jgi:hypothetical protein
VLAILTVKPPKVGLDPEKAVTSKVIAPIFLATLLISEALYKY